MDGDGIVKICLARAHFYGDGKALQHFIDAVANHLDADDFFFRANADQFHQGFRRMGGKGARHRRESGAIDFDRFIAKCAARGGFVKADDANRRVGTYSLGMGQRLGLATALLGKPERLVLDEPVNGLDPQGVRWIRRLLRAHADAGGTVLLSSHLIGELAEIVDDIVIINGGRIKAWGGVADVMAGHPSLEEAFFAHVEARA